MNIEKLKRIMSEKKTRLLLLRNQSPEIVQAETEKKTKKKNELLTYI